MSLLLAQVVAGAESLHRLTQHGRRAWPEGVVVDGWHGGRVDPNDGVGAFPESRGKFGGVVIDPRSRLTEPLPGASSVARQAS